ncbi:MAG: efflux RND transporter periplasmic adaptor subunit [Magnetococcus sp. WYHC-3]
MPTALPPGFTSSGNPPPCQAGLSESTVREVVMPLLLIVPWLALALFLIPTGWLYAQPPAAAPPPEVGVITLQPETLTLTTTLSGRAVAWRTAAIRPQVTGIILEQLFTEGHAVKAGDLLYRIDPALHQAAVDSARAAVARDGVRVATAQLKVDRGNRLLASTTLSQEAHDDLVAALKEARANLAVSEAALRRAEIDLNHTRITAPIAGIIGRSAVSVGALVNAHQDEALAVVRQLDPILVDLTQAGSDWLHSRRNLNDPQREPPTAPLSLILPDGHPLGQDGRLLFAETAVAESTGSVTLRALFPNPDGHLLPGMAVQAVVPEGVLPKALLVPQQGVTHDARGKPTALVVDADGKVQRRDITLERSVGNRWLVSTGLQPGDQLVVEGTQKARPGMPVRAVPASSLASPGNGKPSSP